MTYYDIALIVTPKLIETHPSYAGVDLFILATAYDEVTANLLLKFMESVADENAELFVRARGSNPEMPENDSALVIGIFSND